MSKIGINISIDVTKIDKSRLFQGKKGTYLSLTTFIDSESPDQYDNTDLFLNQQRKKRERLEFKHLSWVIAKCFITQRTPDRMVYHTCLTTHLKL